MSSEAWCKMKMMRYGDAVVGSLGIQERLKQRNSCSDGCIIVLPDEITVGDDRPTGDLSF